ncbi:MAG: YfhO family protein, partial [Bacteroidia bacterium]
ILLFKGRHWLGLAITSLFTAMELNANHVQISYYGYILIAFIIAGYFITALNQKQLASFAKAFAFFIIASIAGILPNAGNLMTTNEYGKYSTRGKSELTINYNSIKAARSKAVGLDGSSAQPAAMGNPVDEAAKERYAKNTTTGLDKDYITMWSYGVGETFTFLIPDFKGGASAAIGNADPNSLKKVNADYRQQVAGSNAYFGDQSFTSGPVYIGAIVILLAFIGMFVIKSSLKWPLFFGTLLTMALAWGNNFMALSEFFIDHVPGYNKFRAVSMLMVIAELTIPLLAVLAVNDLLKYKNWNETVRLRLLKKDVSLKKIIIISASVVGGFCLLCYLAPDMVNNFQAKGEDYQIAREYVKAGATEDQAQTEATQLLTQIEVARKAIFKSDALRSLIFILFGMGTLFLYFTNKIKKELFFAALGLFITIDLWTVDTRYLNDKSFVTKDQNLQNITAKTAADEEILKDPDPDYRVLNLTTNTFADASTSYYHKSIGGYHGAKLKKYAELYDFHIEEEIQRFYKNINKAAASDSLLNELMGSLNVINMLNTKYFIIPAGGEERTVIPFKNPQANGSAWFVKSLRTVQNADSEIVGLYYINTKVQAILNEKYKNELALKNSYSGEGTIKLTSYQPNDLTYESDSKEEQFAVFSEIYYPQGWNAYIDGQLKPHANVDFVLRGMTIPAGKHKIEFKFEPQTYKTRNTVAMIGSILLLILVGAGIYLHRKNNVIVS